MTTSPSTGQTGDPATTDVGSDPTPTPSDTMASAGHPSETSSGPVPGDRFAIVGIGASAGGLAAFESFFSAIP